MKKIVLAFILTLILTTSLVKNSTKEIEDKIFNISEALGVLEVEYGDILLEYNYLSSPEQLTKYQVKYFENEYIKIDITKIKEIKINNSLLVITDFKIKSEVDE
jgi:hypothetical protein